jgi:uncharacterized damage-inducible protein DinB
MKAVPTIMARCATLNPEEAPMSELAELLERYRRGAELIATVMTGAAGAELDFVPEPGHWSVRQIVAHLADGELVSADRLRRIIAEENPTLIAFDQDAWAKNLDYARRKTSQSIEKFRRLRTESYALLTDLPPEAFERKGTHNQRGPVTLRQLVEIMANHVESHVGQIRGVRERYKQSRPTLGS